MNAIAGISGGRTSAFMASRLDENVVLSFQNTGVEHPATYEFLERLEVHLGRPIVWLEWVSPPEGEAPAKATFRVVTPETASRKGEPFRAMLKCLADYRRVQKGLGPIAPWSMQRLCTSYLKIRTQRKYCEALGWDTYDEYVGLRADEPRRIVQARARATHARGVELPLADAGITEADVLAYWRAQPFDLKIPSPIYGNCVGCFLKDEADLSRVMADPTTDAEWWIAIQRDYPGFGGNDKTLYWQLRAEAPIRLEIEAELRAGREVATPKKRGRNRLVVLQEKKRFRAGSTSFACNCEVGADEI